jgi:thiol-disulfide isomerase/thioredoxin
VVPAPPSAADPGSPATGAGEPLPDVTLPCFVGGQPVRLPHLGAPTVINLWASWCAPCRTELPQVQRYAERAAGRVQVIGVITSDPNRGGAQSLIDDLGLRFPMLYDESATLRARVGVQVLPVTLLVDAHGRVAYRYNARPLDEAALADLVQRYLGVRV